MHRIAPRISLADTPPDIATCAAAHNSSPLIFIKLSGWWKNDWLLYLQAFPTSQADIDLADDRQARVREAMRN